MQFVRLGPIDAFDLDQAASPVFVKVVTGRLDDVNRVAYPPPRVVRESRLTAACVTAGADGAVFAVFTAGPAASEPVTDMDRLQFRDPHAQALGWETFEARYHRATPYFDGLDAHLAPGFRQLDVDTEHPGLSHSLVHGSVTGPSRPLLRACAACEAFRIGEDSHP